MPAASGGVAAPYTHAHEFPHSFSVKAFLIRPEFQWSAWLGFSAGMLSAAIWLTLLYDATRSELMAAIWHALINICRRPALAVSTATFLAFGQIVFCSVRC